MFVSIVWYITTMNRPSQTINVRGTKHLFRNGLRISVLDEDLSQAQLAQLEEFLDLDVDFVLSWAENGHTSPFSLSTVFQM